MSRSFLLVIGVLFLCAETASAAIITYSDRTTWQTAVGGPTTLEDFNSVGSDIPLSLAGTSVGPVTLFSNGGSGPSAPNEGLLDAVPLGGFGQSGINGTLVNSIGLDVGEYIDVVLPEPASAFGFDFENYDVNGDGLDIFVDGTLAGTIPAGPFGFFGLIDTMGSFTTVRFASNTNNGNGTFNSFDNIEFNQAAPVPEPASLALWGLLSAGGLVVYRRRKRHPS